MIFAANTPLGVVPSRRTASKSKSVSGVPGSHGVSLKRWNYSFGLPATPVAFNSSHSSVLPLRWLAHTIKQDISDRIT